jgi:outer membrane scaffolding protein for murein synthesis (MipA/OmpV family)
MIAMAAAAMATPIAAQAQSAPVEAPAPSPVEAERPIRPALPLWELGLGAAALRLPDYRGSDAYNGYLLPLPYIVYRGKYLRAGKDGARLLLIDSDRIDFDISLNAGPPAHSDPGGVRAGMATLPATVEVGPKLRAVLWRGAGSRLSLDLPLRAAIALQATPRSVGTVFSPNLDLGLSTGTPWRLGLQAGPVWGSRQLHQHYYGVSSAEAVNSPMLQRPAYQARGGYGGWHALAGLSRRYDNFWVGSFVRHDHVGGAVFADSPLVRKTSHWSAGLGLVWIFAASDEQVTRED